MKKTYVRPETEITVISFEDILTTSKLIYADDGEGGYIDGDTIL